MCWPHVGCWLHLRTATCRLHFKSTCLAFISLYEHFNKWFITHYIAALHRCKCSSIDRICQQLQLLLWRHILYYSNVFYFMFIHVFILHLWVNTEGAIVFKKNMNKCLYPLPPTRQVIITLRNTRQKNCKKKKLSKHMWVNSNKMKSHKHSSIHAFLFLFLYL